MFKCKGCKVLEESLHFERNRTQELQDKLMALANPEAYCLTNPSPQLEEDREYIDYDEYGQVIYVKEEDLN